MTTRKRGFERRRSERHRRRMPCELTVNGRRHRGFVLDLSERGLYVQTRIAPRPHDAVRVQLRDESGRTLELETRVARRYIVPERLASVVRGGVGLEVQEAPEGFRALAAEHARRAAGGDAPQPAAAAPRARRYRVRLQKRGSTRSRTLEVDAASSEAAMQAAREEAGDAGGEWEAVSAAEATPKAERAAR